MFSFYINSFDKELEIAPGASYLKVMKADFLVPLCRFKEKYF